MTAKNLKSKFYELQYSIPERAALSGDPVKLAAEKQEIIEQIEGIDRVIEVVKFGQEYVAKLEN